MSMFPIATTTAGAGGIAAFDFINIPQTFTHLQLRVFGYSTLSASVDNLALYFNNDTGNNYATHSLYTNGSSALTYAGTSQARFYLPSLFPAATTSQFCSAIIDVLDYTNTSKYKTVRTLSGYDANGSGIVGLTSGLWMSTSAISRFSGGTSANLAQYSRIDLYGISTSNVTGA